MKPRVQGTAFRRVRADMFHYAFMYGQDGPVVVKFFRKSTNRWKRLMGS